MKFPIAASLCILAVATAPAQRASRADTATLQRMLLAEDSRATQPAPLLAALHSKDATIRQVAVRGLGRLQRPQFAENITALLGDPVPAVRSEAANALSQAVVRVRRTPADSGQAAVRSTAKELIAALDREQDRATGGAIAEALGRLPFGDSTTGRAAETAILAHAGNTPGFWDVHGLYWIALFRQRTGGLSPNGVALLKSSVFRYTDAATARVAILALTAARAVDSAVIATAMKDPDEQLRRLALAGVAALSADYRRDVVRAAFADSSVIVRVAAISAARAGSKQPDCRPIVDATRDPSFYVAQVAIDSLSLPCADEAPVVAALHQVMTRSADAAGWQLIGHAAVALATKDRAGIDAGPLSQSPKWLLRMYAARTAAITTDTVLLRRLAFDADHNVREAAIDGLATVTKHGADSIYIAELKSPGYQVTLAAAKALGGSKDSAAVPALIAAMDRITKERKENSRDPRIEILHQIGALGTPTHAGAVTRYLADFDSTVADTAARILSRWSKSEVKAQPQPLKIAPLPLAKTFLAQSVLLKVTMAPASGGGTFTIKLFANEAPATTARIVALALAHFYDGHLFQRVEPNFVVQGGGPDATEYVGAPAFMRDEVLARSHMRGTLGISSRGYDTGDGQWFFNLTDNTRLDHLYTVFGEVVTGLKVVERIMEGDEVRSVVVAH